MINGMNSLRLLQYNPARRPQAGAATPTYGQDTFVRSTPIPATRPGTPSFLSLPPQAPADQALAEVRQTLEGIVRVLNVLPPQDLDNLYQRFDLQGNADVKEAARVIGQPEPRDANGLMRMLNALSAGDMDKLIKRFNLAQNKDLKKVGGWLQAIDPTNAPGVMGLLSLIKPKKKAAPPPPQDLAADTAYVTGLYRELLGREPDAEGLQAHLNGLKGGTTREALRQIFLDSAEYKEKQSRPVQAEAAPAPAAQPAVHPGVGPVPLEGYDAGKLNNLSHRTPKYIFGRVASHYPLNEVKNHADADALLKRMRPELEAAGLQVLTVDRDKIQVITEIGVEWVDVVRGAGSGNPGWWWGSEGKGTPLPPGFVYQPGGQTAPAAPQAPKPSGALPSLPTVPVTDEFANARIDKSSIHAALLSTATWVKETYPQLFTQGDDRALAVQMMSKVIGALRYHGYDAYRIVNHPSLPADNPVRYGSDALVLNDVVYDVYGSLGEANRPQVLEHGPMSGNQRKE